MATTIFSPTAHCMFLLIHKMYGPFTRHSFNKFLLFLPFNVHFLQEVILLDGKPCGPTSIANNCVRKPFTLEVDSRSLVSSRYKCICVMFVPQRTNFTMISCFLLWEKARRSGYKYVTAISSRNSQWRLLLSNRIFQSFSWLQERNIVLLISLLRLVRHLL